MANINAVYQQKHTVSIPRESLVAIASNTELSKTDYRVFLALLTELNGYNGKISNDPQNFTEISVKKIARLCGVDRDKIKSSIKKLTEHGYIEGGSNNTVKDGLRFTF